MSKKKKYRKIKKKDYKDKSLQNPFFKDRKQGRGSKKNTFRFKKIILLMFTIAIFTTALWFFYLSNTFKITSIEISGEFRVSQEEIENLIKRNLEGRKFIFPNDNIFVLNKEIIIEDLQNNYNFAKIEVSKIIPDKLSVVLSDRQYMAIWFEEGNYYYIDDQGYVLDKINTLEEIDLDNYPIIENQSAILIKDNIVNKEIESIDFILQAWQSFKEEKSDLSIEKFIIKNEKNSLNLQLASGPVLYLNLLEDSKEQINNFIILYQEEIKDNIDSLNYIDLRYNETIYYK
jgi:cell division septal protein FtsQ